MDLSEDKLMEEPSSSNREDVEERLQEVDMDTVSEENRGFRQYVRPEQDLPPHRSISPRGLVLEEVDLVSGPNLSEGGHSSEEELEEIITKKHLVYKRKWTEQSDTSNTESDQELEELVGGDRGTTPSTGSEEGEPDHNHNLVGRPGTPLQFSTSPPGGVHKPRRSLSPPDVGVQTQHFSLFRREAGLSSSLGDLSRLDDGRIDVEEEQGGKKTISPRKRSRTSRVQHIQRPCLDFEKMQQLRARAVSWRTGGELSLFCW